MLTEAEIETTSVTPRDIVTCFYWGWGVRFDCVPDSTTTFEKLIESRKKIWTYISQVDCKRQNNEIVMSLSR